MKRHLLRSGVALVTTCLAVLVLAGTASAFSTGNGGWQWQNPLPQGGSYANGWFLDDAHGWLISGGDILHTSNGGGALTVQARHNVTFQDITFADARHGWAVGDPANADTGTLIVYRTTNGGRTWVRLRQHLVGGVSTVSFASRRVGWAISGNAVLRTVDGGRHWSIRLKHKTDQFTDVQALGTRRAWASDYSSTLLHTVNGGATWRRFRTGTREVLTHVQFTSSSTGWAAGGGTIVHTADGGAHWTSQLSIDSEIGALAFADSRNGWASASHLYHTTDGGAHWTQQAAAPPFRSWIFALTPSAAVVGGSAGRLGHTADAGTTWQSTGRSAGDYFGDLHALQFVDSKTGWAAGSAGEILKTNDGGVRWSPQASHATQDLNGVDFFSADDGWAVGDQGAILATTDGGATWTPQTSSVADDLKGVTFVDSQRGWATGGTVDYLSQNDLSSGVILHTGDGGLHWLTQALPVSDAALNDIVFADELHGWAVGEVVGDAGTNVTVILATKNGGVTWTKQLAYRPPMTGNTSHGVLTSVACIDAKHVVAVGSDDSATEIFRTSNGGAKWTRFVRPASWRAFSLLELADVFFADAAHGWAVGSGAIIKTSDGGRTWTRPSRSAGPNEGLNALSFVGRKHGWVAGNSAAILTTTTGGSVLQGGR